MPESTQVPTAPGTVYSVTCSGDCIVTTEVAGETITLATLTGGGQATFQAVSASVVVSNPAAILLPFDGAPASLGRAGGVTQEVVEKAIASALFDEVSTRLSTGEGTGIGLFNWAEFDAVRVPEGELLSVEVTPRASGNPATSSYLGLWQQSEDGTSWEYLGSSSNASAQRGGTPTIWNFEPGIRLSGRSVRIVPQEEPSSIWGTTRSLGAKLTIPVPEGENSRVAYKGAFYSFLVNTAFSVKKAVPKFAPASHVGDPTHLQEEGRVLRLTANDGYPALVMSCAEGYTSITTPAMLITTISAFRVNSSHPAFYSADENGLINNVFFAVSDGDGSTEDINIYDPGIYIGGENTPNYNIKMNASQFLFNGQNFNPSAS